MQDSLKTKAWLIHCLFMTTRIIIQLTGISYWQTISAEDDSENENSGANFKEDFDSVLKPTFWFLTCIGVLLDILTWHRKKVANCLLYYEILILIAESSVPTFKDEFGKSLLMVLRTLLNYICLACELRISIIVSLIASALI